MRNRTSLQTAIQSHVSNGLFGFCLNVSLNNESTNLRDFQIAWVSGYNHITWRFYSSYKRGITGCEHQRWGTHPVRTEAQHLGLHWKLVGSLRGHRMCGIWQHLSLLAPMWSYFHFKSTAATNWAGISLESLESVTRTCWVSSAHHGTVIENVLLFRMPCLVWLQLPSGYQEPFPDRKTEMEASI